MSLSRATDGGAIDAGLRAPDHQILARVRPVRCPEPGVRTAQQHAIWQEAVQTAFRTGSHTSRWHLTIALRHAVPRSRRERASGPLCQILAASSRTRSGGRFAHAAVMLNGHALISDPWRRLTKFCHSEQLPTGSAEISQSSMRAPSSTIRFGGMRKNSVASDAL